MFIQLKTGQIVNLDQVVRIHAQTDTLNLEMSNSVSLSVTGEDVPRIRAIVLKSQTD